MTDPRCTNAFDPRLDAVARYALAIGALLVLLLPAARGSSEQIGWLPMWLVVMPALAWWGVHGFAFPRRRGPEVEVRRIRARRGGPQARRRVKAGVRVAWSRAA